MERRWIQRRPIRLNVVIHGTGNRLISGRVRDLSPDGIYVETDQEVEPGHDGVLRVGFMINNVMQIARAQITHREHSGLGLRFTETGEGVHEAVAELFKPAATAPPPTARYRAAPGFAPLGLL